jgi:hypothetical protein
LETTAIGGVVAGSLSGAESAMPMRTLGKTGIKVSILALAGGSRFYGFKTKAGEEVGYRDEEKAVAFVKRAFDLGINYFDTADDYGNSEERFGLALKAHGRKGITVVTKISARDGAGFNRNLERSLKRLGVDQLDILHLHGIMNDADMARAEAPGAALEQLQKAKEQKLTRFIGITCHAAPLTLQAALERHDFDCAQMALNAAQSSLHPPRGTTAVFENTALPVAVRKNMGIIAMKIWLQDFLPDVPERTARNLMYYTLSLPVATALIGSPKPEYFEENVKLAKAFKPLTKAEMLELSNSLSKYKLAMDNVFRHHIDA